MQLPASGLSSELKRPTPWPDRNLSYGKRRSQPNARPAPETTPILTASYPTLHDLGRQGFQSSLIADHQHRPFHTNKIFSFQMAQDAGHRLTRGADHLSHFLVSQRGWQPNFAVSVF